MQASLAASCFAVTATAFPSGNRRFGRVNLLPVRRHFAAGPATTRIDRSIGTRFAP